MGGFAQSLGCLGDAHTGYKRRGLETGDRTDKDTV